MRLRLLLALVVLGASAACGSSSSPTAAPSPTPSTSGTAVSVVRGASTLTNTAYAPNPVTIAVGGTVMWTNNDTTSHTATAADGTWNSGTLAPGATFSRTFPTAGSFPYMCTIHPGMVGTVTVQ